VRDAARSRWAPAILLAPCPAALLAHGGGVSNGFINWDDPQYVIGNPLTVDPLAHGIDGLLLSRPINYPVPVTVLGYAAQRAAFESTGHYGIDPRGFHAVSIALHALIALLVAWIARRFGAGRLGAAAAAALFAAHPLTVEPVAWVTGQKDLLAALFALSAIAIRAGPRGAERGRSLAVAALAVLALASKPSAVAVPALLVAVDVARGRSLRRAGALALYALLAAIAAADIALAIVGHEAGGVSPTGRFGLASLADACWTYALQLGHVAWPAELLPRYFAPSGAWYAVEVGLGLLLAALSVAGALYAWRRGAKEVAFALTAALLAYLPTGGILPLPRGPADSYMYLPLALATVALARILSRFFDVTSALERLELWAALALALGIAIVAARGQTTMWRSSTTLWTALADAYPDDPRALMRVGDAYLFERTPSEALLVFEDIAHRYPEFDGALGSHADTLTLLGRPAEAEQLYARAARAHDRREMRESYAFFLITHPSVAPSDNELAHRALVELAPVLAERGKRPRSLRRAATLLDRYGETAPAAAVRARAREVEHR